MALAFGLEWLKGEGVQEPLLCHLHRLGTLKGESVRDAGGNKGETLRDMDRDLTC